MRFAVSIVGLLLVGAVNSFAVKNGPQMGPSPSRQQYDFVFDKHERADSRRNYGDLVRNSEGSRLRDIQAVWSDIYRLRALAEWQGYASNSQPLRLALALRIDGGIEAVPIRDFSHMPTHGIQDDDVSILRRKLEHLAKTYPDKQDEILKLTKHLSQLEPSNRFTYLSAEAKREKIATQIRALAELSKELDAKMGSNSFQSATVTHNGNTITFKKDGRDLYILDKNGTRSREVKFEMVDPTKSKPVFSAVKNTVKKSGGGGTVVSLSVAAFLGLVINQSMVGDGEAAEARKAQPSAMHQPYLSVPAVGPAAAK